ncbi:hypothetical protein Taro_044497 [Colocasia esculenta]|uniref:Uncharacterized protein n=1 Tax=Colocasia esculenta TaxID=4460 RepID=A0A843X5I9_COLES|nr:hypothetical protein [Colocasia esculenta]
MLQPVAKLESESTTPPHGTDYWFMMPVSNPDNTSQELPFSLAVTDVTHPAVPCLAPLETLARAP